MHTLSASSYLMPYLVSNLVGAILLPIAFFRPRLMRIIFLLMFAGAAAFNAHTAAHHPDAYMMYSDTAIPLYRGFILGWFSEHIATSVFVIAAAQALIALGLLLKGPIVKWALAGIIFFLLCIAPLGIGAAFPFSLTVSLAAYWVMKKDDAGYLWQKNEEADLTTISQ